MQLVNVWSEAGTHLQATNSGQGARYFMMNELDGDSWKESECKDRLWGGCRTEVSFLDGMGLATLLTSPRVKESATCTHAGPIALSDQK